jgi:hypothetical protein
VNVAANPADPYIPILNQARMEYAKLQPLWAAGA